tara:strand:- start:481 stop:663 length:183 start_codon:yes stop_codon:yes gene_type:complete
MPYAALSFLYSTVFAASESASASARAARRVAASSGVKPSGDSSNASLAIRKALTAAGMPP